MVKLTNEEIESYFRIIRNIADGYLNSQYPEAPDPNVAMEKIESLVDEYYQREVE